MEAGLLDCWSRMGLRPKLSEIKTEIESNNIIIPSPQDPVSTVGIATDIPVQIYALSAKRQRCEQSETKNATPPQPIAMQLFHHPSNSDKHPTQRQTPYQPPKPPIQPSPRPSITRPRLRHRRRRAVRNQRAARRAAVVPRRTAPRLRARIAAAHEPAVRAAARRGRRHATSRYDNGDSVRIHQSRHGHGRTARCLAVTAGLATAPARRGKTGIETRRTVGAKSVRRGGRRTIRSANAV
jgi:hypothetical protein